MGLPEERGGRELSKKIYSKELWQKAIQFYWKTITYTYGKDTPSGINAKKSTKSHIIENIQKLKRQGEKFESSYRRTCAYKGIPITLTTEFSG